MRGVGRGAPIGLTTLLADSSEINLAREEVLNHANSIMTTSVAPVYSDRDLVAREAMRRFKETEKMDIASFRIEEVYVHLGTGGPRDVPYIFSMTPLRDMILRSLTLYPIKEQDGVTFSAWIHAELLGSVRRHRSGWSLDD